MFDLKTLALRRRQRFVIGDFSDQARHTRAEAVREFLLRCGGVLKSVVQHRSDNEVDVAAAGGLCDKLCDFRQVIHVGFGGFAFAPLGNVFYGGEVVGFCQFDEIVQVLLLQCVGC